MMRRLPLLAVAVALTLAGSASATAPPQRIAARACQDGTLIDASGAASLVKYRRDLFGCRRAPERGWRLQYDDHALGDVWRLPRLSGHMAAWYQRITFKEAYYSVYVADLRRGRQCIDDLPAGTTRPEGTPVEALMLTPWGAIAYTTGFGPEYEVMVVDAAGHRPVASGSDIDPDSLYVQGATVQWTQGGLGRATTIERAPLPCRERLAQ